MVYCQFVTKHKKARDQLQALELKTEEEKRLIQKKNALASSKVAMTVTCIIQAYYVCKFVYSLRIAFRCHLVHDCAYQEVIN